MAAHVASALALLAAIAVAGLAYLAAARPHRTRPLG
jgi:hypothetical protein